MRLLAVVASYVNQHLLKFLTSTPKFRVKLGKKPDIFNCRCAILAAFFYSIRRYGTKR